MVHLEIQNDRHRDLPQSVISNFIGNAIDRQTMLIKSRKYKMSREKSSTRTNAMMTVYKTQQKKIIMANISVMNTQRPGTNRLFLSHNYLLC